MAKKRQVPRMNPQSDDYRKEAEAHGKVPCRVVSLGLARLLKVKDVEVVSKVKDVEVGSKVKDVEVGSKVKDVEVGSKAKDVEAVNKVKDVEVVSESKDISLVGKRVRWLVVVLQEDKLLDKIRPLVAARAVVRLDSAEWVHSILTTKYNFHARFEHEVRCSQLSSTYDVEKEVYGKVGELYAQLLN
ncbi:hypothetical protein Ae201684P_020340 [Aphanomyces euteiches]|nr:hypothetical protein Ae201684P_020340 [Aphanomyces euteiches]